jgi:hypothetical protein
MEHNATAESILITNGLEKNDFHGIFIFRPLIYEYIILMGMPNLLNRLGWSLSLFIWI